MTQTESHIARKADRPDRAAHLAAAEAMPSVRWHGNGSTRRAPRAAAAVAIAAVLGISVYSAYRIDRVVASNAPPAIAFSLGPAHRDVTYCNTRQGGLLPPPLLAGSQTLDLYIPKATATGPLPLAIYVHGGGMTSGDKGNLNPLFLNALASAGYAIASVNYRMAPEFKFPAQIEDIKCAIRFLRANAQTYGLDGSKIVAFGTSVGGQLVALAALTEPRSAIDVGPYPPASSSVTAVADMFGPANLTEGAPSGFSPSGIQQVFGTNSTKDDLARASPTHYVTGNAPPILIIQGVNDAKVLESQSIELYNDLKAAGDQTQLVLVQNMGHMFAQVGPKPIDPSLGQVAQDLVTFFDRYTKGT